MAEPTVKDAVRFGNSRGEIKFGHVDRDGKIANVMIRSGQPNLPTPQFMEFIGNGKLAGGTTNVCPGVYQIYCGDTPVNGVAFVLQAESGDVIIGAPGGRVRIFGQSVDIIAEGSGDKGNINLSASNNINMSCKEAKLEASALINFITNGKAYMSAQNTFYINAGLGKLTSNASAPVKFPPAIGNMGPTEIKQMIQKLLGFIGG